MHLIMAGKIYRRKKSSEFVTLDTHCSRNKKIRWAPKGLHTYLFQLPEDWKINLSDLENRSEDGRDSTTSAMNALIRAGYVVRERKHDEKGRFEGYDYFVFERPEHAIEWLAENGKAVNGSPVNGKTATSKVLKPLSEVSNNEGEGERNTPAENHETVEAEIPPSKKVAPKKVSPFRECANCNGTGFDQNNSWGRCDECEGSGQANPSTQFQVTAIASPTEFPNVTLVEAATKRIEAWEHPNPASPKELKGVLLRYADQDPENWRDNVLEAGRATNLPLEKIDECLTDFCAWQFKNDFTRAKLSQYTAAFSLWLKRQKRYDAQVGKQVVNGNGQAVAVGSVNRKILNL